MRRLAALTLALVVMPALPVIASDLEELLERSGSAEYSAEQVIACSTPDGVRDALVLIRSVGGDLYVAASVEGEAQVAAGRGLWAVSAGGETTAVSVDSASAALVKIYSLEEGGPVTFLGRDATAYTLLRVGSPRATLVFDDATGALLEVVTLDGDGSVYCQRRFISFDDTPPARPEVPADVDTTQSLATQPAGHPFPDTLADFDRLDLYEDQHGLSFAYYSDGFFSFAVFETPGLVDPGSDTVDVVIEGRTYKREFTPGQVTYVWETRSGGMALIGDLPPDLHPEVLRELPRPEAIGIWQRLWRRLFG